jgi:hypothetical protein
VHKVEDGAEVILKNGSEAEILFDLKKDKITGVLYDGE